MSKNKVPNSPGVYTLIIRLKKAEKIRVGQLGSRFFPEGHYSYTGSAVGRKAFNLGMRVNYHLKPKNSTRWHIDYLTRSKNTEIEAVVFSETDINRECEVSQSIGLLSEVEVIMEGFGSSDCKMKCKSHLHHFCIEASLPKIVKSVYRIYEKNGLKPYALMLKNTP